MIRWRSTRCFLATWVTFEAQSDSHDVKRDLSLAILGTGLNRGFFRLVGHYFNHRLLPLCLGGDCHATSKDHVDFCHMLISIGGLSAMLSPAGILECQHCWWRHLFAIQKFFAFFQIMSIGAMDFTPLLCAIGASEGSPFLLI
jgi:hypothetical protein